MIEQLTKYAKLIVCCGLNVQENQIVVIDAPVDSYEFVRLISEQAYLVGAREVVVKYNDSVVNKLGYIHSPMDVFEEVAQWIPMYRNDYASKGACFLSLTGSDPEALKGVDPLKVSTYQRALSKQIVKYRDLLHNGTLAWCVVGVSTKPWAKAVFKDLDEDAAVAALWDAIFKATHVYSEDPIETWNRHRLCFESRVKYLNALNIDTLTFKNAKGTDLTVSMVDDYLFAGGGSYLKDGTYNFPNMPTEEIFASPNYLKTSGKVYSSLPLNYNGTLIEDFYFEFKEGKVVDYGAKSGLDVLKGLVEFDEGSCYLGEIALVPFKSPISDMNILFYNTLFDENAVCHLALGSGFCECIKDGLTYSKETLKDKGVNDSLMHVDFMFGTSDLSVVASTKDGKMVTIFDEGNFVF